MICICYKSYIHVYALWIENSSESDTCSYEATKAVAKKAQKKFWYSIEALYLLCTFFCCFITVRITFTTISDNVADNEIWYGSHKKSSAHLSISSITSISFLICFSSCSSCADIFSFSCFRLTTRSRSCLSLQGNHQLCQQLTKWCLPAYSLCCVSGWFLFIFD